MTKEGKISCRISFPFQTIAFQNLTDILYWKVLHGVLTEEFGEGRADELLNPYSFGDKNIDHVCPVWLRTTGERPDAQSFEFSFNIPQVVFLKIIERAKQYHFEAIDSWHPGVRTIVLKCHSSAVTQEWDSWKKMHFGLDENCGVSYDPCKDEIVYDDDLAGSTIE